MARLPKMIPVSDLRDDVAEVLRRVQKSREPLVVTQRGRAAAVLKRSLTPVCGGP